jgi:hypothetical protein
MLLTPPPLTPLYLYPDPNNPSPPFIPLLPLSSFLPSTSPFQPSSSNNILLFFSTLVLLYSHFLQFLLPALHHGVVQSAHKRLASLCSNALCYRVVV